MAKGVKKNDSLQLDDVAKALYLNKTTVSRSLQLDDIAKALCLNKSTVSRAISGKGRVSPETKERVQHYIDEHSYRPNLLARGLATSKSYNIGVVVPRDAFISQVPFFMDSLFGVHEAASAYDYDVLLIPTSVGDMSDLKRVLDNHKADAVILTRNDERDALVPLLKERGCVFALLGTAAEAGILQVDTDTVAACRELIQRMLPKAQRPVLLLGDPNFAVNRKRREGFELAILKAGMHPLVIDGLTDRESIEKAVQRCKGCDLVLTGDDYICDITLSCLERAGSGAMVGTFFWSTLVESHNRAVPSVVIDARALGEACARLVLHELEPSAPLPTEDYSQAYNIRG